MGNNTELFRVVLGKKRENADWILLPNHLSKKQLNYKQNHSNFSCASICHLQ